MLKAFVFLNVKFIFPKGQIKVFDEITEKKNRKKWEKRITKEKK